MDQCPKHSVFLCRPPVCWGGAQSIQNCSQLWLIRMPPVCWGGSKQSGLFAVLAYSPAPSLLGGGAHGSRLLSMSSVIPLHRVISGRGGPHLAGSDSSSAEGDVLAITRVKVRTLIANEGVSSPRREAHRVAPVFSGRDGGSSALTSPS